MTLSNLTLLTTLKFTPSADPQTIGFIAELTNPSAQLGDLKVFLEDQPFYNTMIQPFVKILKGVVNAAVGSINQQLHDLCSKPLQPEFKIGEDTYQFDINFPQGLTQQDSDLRIPVNIKSITNLNTNATAPGKQEIDIPDIYFNQTHHNDLEILLGTGITNQLVWTVADSKLLTLTINQNSTFMKGLPLTLSLEGMQSFLPGLYDEYVTNRKMPGNTGIYIQVYIPQQAPDFRLVGGRLTGQLNASAKFYVELNKDEYPVADVTKCDCDLGADISLTLYVAADVYTPSKLKIGADISNLQIVSSTKTAGPIAFDGDRFATSATALIYNFIGIINQKLTKGIDIPYISQAPFIQDLTLVFEQGCMFVDLGIDTTK